MQYVIPPIKKIYLTPTKYPPPKKKKYEDNFYEVQTIKCTKTLYQTVTEGQKLYAISKTDN